MGKHVADPPAPSTSYGHISMRGCCPGCGDCYGMSINCHREPCVCAWRNNR